MVVVNEPVLGQNQSECPVACRGQNNADFPRIDIGHLKYPSDAQCFGDFLRVPDFVVELAVLSLLLLGAITAVVVVRDP